MKNNSTQSGYVLPYVLGIIFLLTAVTTIAANYLIDSSRIMGHISESTQSDLAFQSAQAAMEYLLVNSSPIDGGMDLSGQSDPLDAILGGGNTELAPSQIWQVNGAWRQLKTQQGPVYIQLQDTSGLVSLNTGSERTIALLLVGLGIEKGRAKQLAASLADYRDSDNTRRFQGAERADYRLQQMSPPTNSLLRSYGELSLVMGWSDIIPSIDWNRFVAMTSLSLTSSRVNFNFAPPRLAEFLSEQKSNSDVDANRDLLGTVISESKTPSRQFRILMLHNLNSPIVKQQIIETKLTPGHVWKPFETILIYEGSLSRDEALLNELEQSEIEHVFTATPTTN